MPRVHRDGPATPHGPARSRTRRAHPTATEADPGTTAAPAGREHPPNPRPPRPTRPWHTTHRADSAGNPRPGCKEPPTPTPRRQSARPEAGRQPPPIRRPHARARGSSRPASHPRTGPAPLRKPARSRCAARPTNVGEADAGHRRCSTHAHRCPSGTVHESPFRPLSAARGLR